MFDPVSCHKARKHIETVIDNLTYGIAALQRVPKSRERDFALDYFEKMFTGLDYMANMVSATNLGKIGMVSAGLSDPHSPIKQNGHYHTKRTPTLDEYDRSLNENNE